MTSKKAQKLFQKYYLAYRTDMYWYIARKVNSRDIAEDLTADLFIKLLENPEVMLKRKGSGVKAWLYTVARNMVIDHYRKSANREGRNVEMDEEVFEVVAKTEERYLDIEIKNEEIQLVVASLEILSTEEKELIKLRFDEELKFSEIAIAMDKEEGAVKMQLYRALEKIKKQIGSRLETDNKEDKISK